MGVISHSSTAAAAIQFQSQQPSPPSLLRVRGIFPAIRGGGAFSISTTRTQICFPKRRLLFFRVKSVESSSVVDELQDFKVVPSNVLATQKEEQEQHISEASPTNLPLDSKKLKAMARMTKIGTDGQLPLNTLYLVDLGLDMNQIKGMARKWPTITRPGWGRNIRPLFEFLLDLGVPQSCIPNILYRTPNLCNLSLSENIIPFMAYLEALGLDKSKWAKVIRRCPHLLARSRQKLDATVDYLCELGVSRGRIGRVLTRCPEIIGFSVDDNLRLKVEYFRSMGVNVTSLLGRYPEVFGRSIECKLKPLTEFFLDKGFSIDEIGTMASRFGSIYSMSLTKNLIPKWDFFLTMDYPREVLVTYPTYFGYSLERRIKPRYSQVRECGVKLSFGRFLYTSDSDFLEILNSLKMKKMLEAQHGSMAVTSDEDLESNIPEPLQLIVDEQHYPNETEFELKNCRSLDDQLRMG